MPDSTSSVTPTRRLSWSPLPRSTANTAAASVDDTTAPSSSASPQPRPSQCAPTATSVAVPATPMVASTPAGAAARRTALSGVLSPPSNRISASASDADPERELVVAELDAADPLGARQHPDAEEEQGDRHAEALRGPAEQHADRRAADRRW